MDVNSPVAVALIAAVVSVLATLLTNRATARTGRSAIQTQYQEIIKKRIEFYPKLWKIMIHYETNWTLAGQPMTREWAQEYAHELNEFNLDGGVFFSQSVYAAFFQLRQHLHDAIRETQPGAEVTRDLTSRILQVTSGDVEYGPGLSTHLKNDLGSYRSVVLAQHGK